MKTPLVRLFTRLAFASAVLLASVTARAVTVYSNVTTFSGQGYAGSGAATSAGTTTTRLVADDINFAVGAAGQMVTGFTFSVGNFNTSAVSASALVRLYADDGSGGGPGTLLGAINLNPIALAPGKWPFSTTLPAAPFSRSRPTTTSGPAWPLPTTARPGRPRPNSTT